MLTIQQIIDNSKEYSDTHPGDLMKNARDVNIRVTGIEEYEDDDGDIYKEITIRARSKRRTARSKDVHLWIWQTRGGTYNRNSKCRVQCTCDFYKYYCDEALFEKDSSFNEDGTAPFEANPALNQDITNPHLIPWACKHILQAFRIHIERRKAKSIRKRKKKKVK